MIKDGVRGHAGLIDPGCRELRLTEDACHDARDDLMLPIVTVTGRTGPVPRLKRRRIAIRWSLGGLCACFNRADARRARS